MRLYLETIRSGDFWELTHFGGMPPDLYGEEM